MSKEGKEKKHFFKDFKAELKKVIWPTPKQLVNNTIAVVVIVIVVTLIVFALDFVFGEMNSLINKGVASLTETSTNSIVEDNVNEEKATSEEIGIDTNTEIQGEETTNTDSEE